MSNITKTKTGEVLAKIGIFPPTNKYFVFRENVFQQIYKAAIVMTFAPSYSSVFVYDYEVELKNAKITATYLV